MRKILFILLLISVLVNLAFLVVWNGRNHENEKKLSLFTYKKIKYEEGYKYLENRISKRYPKLNLKNRNSIICFWDSMSFEVIGYETMSDLDSLAGALGKYSFNYICATEMEEKVAKDYLRRAGVTNQHLTIAGDMDKYISAVYNTYRTKRKMTFHGDTSKANLFRRYKTKPYYLIMDTSGKVIFYNDRYMLLSKDTSFVKAARTSIITKPIEKL